MTDEQEKKTFAARDHADLSDLSPGSGVRKQVPRPDRADKVAMTTRVSPRLRESYRELSGRLGAKMEDLQRVALRSFLPNLWGLSRREQRVVWADLLKTYPAHSENDADDD
jgi:hypothetical protein